MYQLLRRFLFLFPAEGVHYFAMNTFRLAGRAGLGGMLRNGFNAPADHPCDAFGLHFRNPVGLGAGFDKNALFLDELDTLGFGYVEIGTVTPLPQAGNDKPRLFRLPLDKALINRMGFNNDGVKVVAERVKAWRQKNNFPLAARAAHPGIIAQTDPSHPDSGFTKYDTHPNKESQTSNLKPQISNLKSQIILGGNIGKNKITPNEDAWKDYEICFRELYDCVDYFVVNVSSPNTPGLRELQEKASLHKILSHLQGINQQLAHQYNARPKPLLLKIAPDLTPEQINDVIDLALEIKLDGLVATNTTISRAKLLTSQSTLEKIGAGGLSGEPLRKHSTEIVRYIATKSEGKIPIIASGGIFTADDAKEKLAAGATLVQVWTGFIYEGPGIVKKIVGGL